MNAHASPACAPTLAGTTWIKMYDRSDMSAR
jgi:hypothetical protein